MARKAPSNNQDGRLGRTLYVLPVIVLAVMVCLPAYAAGEENTVLKDSGIVYPGGFDLNTIGEVRGKAGRIAEPEKGPVYFILSAENDSYTVLVCPVWYWKKTGFEIAEGKAVTVRGSKSMGRDSKLYIIAQDIMDESTGKRVTIRGMDGRPVWSNASRMGERGTMRRGPMNGSGSRGRQNRGR